MQWYRAAFDRYERSLPEPTEFRDEAQAESWRRTRDASRHLADHLAERARDRAVPPTAHPVDARRTTTA